MYQLFGGNVSSAKPLEGTIESYDSQRGSGGRIIGTVRNYWFHQDAYCQAIPAWNAPVLGKAKMRRVPQAGDKVVFFPTSSCSGPKALKWTFADDYEKAKRKMASQKVEASQQELLLQPHSTPVEP